MRKPFVWQMIKEAVGYLNDKASYSDIKAYINKKWGNVNSLTITDQIQVLTVNHKSRIHYPENHKARLTNTGSQYDILYTTGRGQVVKYNPELHGIWEIFINERNKPEIKLYEEKPREIYTPADLIWFKNVTNDVDGEAYLSLKEDIFVLHFPTKHKGNILSPEVNELILIYQKVKGVAAFTHIVTPIDNKLEEGDREGYRFGRKVKVIAKVDSDNIIPVSSTLWNRVKLGGVIQGNACKIENISNIGNIDELRFDVWQKFRQYFIPEEQLSESSTSGIISELQRLNSDFTVTEGGLRLVAHLIKERNNKIIKEKKKQAIASNSLRCEVCSFSFIKTFNSNFIECHHISPIAQTGIRETTLDDLALVCSNCHRMLHMKFDGQYLNIEQLRAKMKKN